MYVRPTKQGGKNIFKKRGNRLRKRKMVPIYRKVLACPPNYQVVKLSYNDPLFFTSSAGSVASAVYRINDLFDPYQTGVGRQALFRDQMFSMYRSARCLGAMIKVVFVGGGSSAQRIVLSKIESGTADSSVSVAGERVPKVLRLYQPGSSNNAILKIYQSSDNYFGLVKGSTLRDNDFIQTSTSSIGADRSMWYQIVAADITGASSTVYCNVEIVQYVRFENPLQVSGS